MQLVNGFSLGLEDINLFGLVVIMGRCGYRRRDAYQVRKTPRVILWIPGCMDAMTKGMPLENVNPFQMPKRMHKSILKSSFESEKAGSNVHEVE